jgi:hypothetical protein
VTDADILRLCIDRVRRTKYPSGGWQAERACVVDLDGRQHKELFAATGIVYGSKIAFDCAAAARRIGEWLRSVTKETPC